MTEVKKNMPLVSIACITYNHEHYIAQTIDSFLMQHTNFFYEIIIGEDCSTDGTRKIIETYCEKYPDQVKLITTAVNVGARKNGIRVREQARGKYIAMCEGDDYWTDPLKLQKQVDFLEGHPEYVISFHDCRIVDDKGLLLRESKLEKERKRNLTKEEIIFGTLMPTNTVVFRNGIIKKYPDEFLKVLNGDAFLFALLGEHGKAHYAWDVIPAVYRVHSGGVWSMRSSSSKIKNRINTYEQLLNVIGEKHRSAVKERLFISNIQFAVQQTGMASKIKQYLSAYKYFSFSGNSLKYFFVVNTGLLFTSMKRIVKGTK